MPPTTDPMDSSDKLALLEAFTLLYDAVSEAESARRRAGHIEEADTIGHWADRLMDQIGELRSGVLDDWLGSAGSLTKKVNTLTGKVRDMIDDLKQDQQWADKMIEIAGYVDDAIGLAAKLLK